MLKTLVSIAKETSRIILEVYNSKDFEVEIKEDKSPLTKADTLANKYIIEQLNRHFDIPIITEESPVDYDVRKNWEEFYLVDPLDGTRGFVNRNDDFTVNIALIKDKVPVTGVIAVPVNGIVYYAEKGKGAFKETDGRVEKISNTRTDSKLIAIASRSSLSDETKDFCEKIGVVDLLRRGSALKFGMLAEGLCDVYPRFLGSSEWDIAAGHCILNEADCKVIDLSTKEEPLYNKEDFASNHFIASRHGLSLI